MNFVVKSENISLIPKIEREVLNFYEFYKDLFNLDNVYFEIRIHNSRSSFDEALGRKTEDWEVGNTKNNAIEIISPENFESESSHNKEEFFPILKHEIGHIFYNAKFKTSEPMWLNEGICSFYGTPKTGRILLKKIDYLKRISLEDMHSSIDFRKIDSFVRYEIVCFVIKNLISEFGEQKLKIFLNSINNPNDENNVNLRFEETFNLRADKFWISLLSKLEEGDLS